MKIEVLFNNESLDERLFVGWGFSCLVDGHLLFDTGEKGRYLFSNMKIMGIDISKIDKVVISHDHWDHWGGLWDLLKGRVGIDVFACSGFSERFKNKVKDLDGNLRELNGAVQVADNISSTGEIAGSYDGKYMAEQALVIKTVKGLTVITGCAHPGILKILKKVKADFTGEKIYAVFGGFHLMDKKADEIVSVVKEFNGFEVSKAGPTHCSGKEAETIFREEYGDNFISVKSGMILEV